MKSAEVLVFCTLSPLVTVKNTNPSVLAFGAPLSLPLPKLISFMDRPIPIGRSQFHLRRREQQDQKTQEKITSRIATTYCHYSGNLMIVSLSHDCCRSIHIFPHRLPIRKDTTHSRTHKKCQRERKGGEAEVKLLPSPFSLPPSTCPQSR